ncbi:MAG: hypothetical protein K9N23_02935 [Akkermansiaceae bacterium]|nr:hypothetical protein [Akkermansiaceae bacterium]MCF7730609.1 hypothetical protein [Akkermansiaceae bacterium]
MIKARAKTCGDKGKAKAATGFSKARKATEYQGRRQKRQQLARLREDANLSRVGEPARRHKGADRERLKGKGLFYCGSPAERAKEIQRRLAEATREDLNAS